MNSKLMNILIVGYGSIGTRYSKIIRAIYPESKIILLRHDKCEESNSDLVDYCFNDLEKVLELSPKIAIISNPASYHIQIAEKLAKEGIHLLIEKPISNSQSGVSELIKYCHENKIVLMTAYNLRFLPSLVFFKEQIELKNLGKILSIRAEVGQYLPTWRPNTDYRKSVSSNQRLGGGALLELSHEIDYLQWIFGSFLWVQAYVTKVSKLEIDVEDTALLLAGLKCNENDEEVGVSLNIDFIRQDTTRKCTVISENGTLCWDGIKGTVEVYTLKSSEWKVLFSDSIDRDFTYREELRHFVTSVDEKRYSSISGEDGLSVLKVVEATKLSSLEKRKVELKELNLK